MSSSVRLWARCTGASGHRLFVHVVNNHRLARLALLCKKYLLSMHTSCVGTHFALSPHLSHLKTILLSIPIASSRLVESAETQQKRRSTLESAVFEAPRRYEGVAPPISMPHNAAEPPPQRQSHSAIRTVPNLFLSGLARIEKKLLLIICAFLNRHSHEHASGRKKNTSFPTHHRNTIAFRRCWPATTRASNFNQQGITHTHLAAVTITILRTHRPEFNFQGGT
ncbi:hypothetical protein BDP55DRAFT_134377 [Colletotrichum godetiae]|uniref:Uncharacterized protein n=1 Tax=Colletotrichum godetiae TaxID=1209918 RepID=A0AAJ0AY83_9PEZI|nr:uncharacterized protein BDP55DRAFT_134377 [Colletotrichum godetiae]KAK1700509.1 hypothetical protein BDP55DRAFT_134377 [Colletotrichum godetiae]